MTDRVRVPHVVAAVERVAVRHAAIDAAHREAAQAACEARDAAHANQQQQTGPRGE